jgi:hypothetical protein
MQRLLNVDPSTVELLKNRGVVVNVTETTEAVDIYNALTDTEPATGFFHSTC